MKTQELRTLAKKAETQPEIVVRKAETNLRQTENSQFKLRLFRVYQPLTSISQQKLNFLKQPTHTTIVDFCRGWPVLSRAERISSKTPAISHIPPNPISKCRLFPGCSPLCPFAFFVLTKPLQSRAVAPAASSTALSRLTEKHGKQNSYSREQSPEREEGEHYDGRGQMLRFLYYS